MRRVDRTTAVDRLEGPWAGLDFKPLEGFAGWWRLRVVNYRVFCTVGREGNWQVVSVEDVKRRGTTTYQ